MEIPDWIKSQVTVPNLLVVLGILSLVLYLTHRPKAAFVTLIISFVAFLLVSTPFLPDFIISQIESQVQPLTSTQAIKDEDVLIHVLGGGYSLSPDLPANVQLGWPTLGRLTEGIRIYRLLPKSTLVTSGYSSLGLESQASVARKAAIALGVDSARVVTLDSPSTTWEEAEALKKKFGTDRTVVVVSDAVHLPRALGFFHAQGFKAVGSASNYLVYKNEPTRPLNWMPSMRNIEKSNIILREYLGTAKGYILN